MYIDLLNCLTVSSSAGLVVSKVPTVISKYVNLAEYNEAVAQHDGSGGEAGVQGVNSANTCFLLDYG